jgi:hypothetical protein
MLKLLRWLLMSGVVTMGVREEWTRPLAELQMAMMPAHSLEGATPRWK